MSPDPYNDLAAAILRAYAPDPADQLCAAFRASLDDTDRVAEALSAAFRAETSGDSGVLARQLAAASRQQANLEMQARWRELQARQEAKYGGLFDRLQASGRPGPSARVWC